MDEINIWLNIAAIIGVAVIGYGGWKLLASTTAMNTINLLEKELAAVRRRLDSRDEENSKLLDQVRDLTLKVVDLTRCASEAKAEAETAKALNALQAEQINSLQQAVGRLARRLELYEGSEPVETLSDQAKHEALNRATIDEGWKELDRLGMRRQSRNQAEGDRTSQQDTRQGQQDDRQNRQDGRQHRQDGREERQDTRDARNDERKPKLEEGD